MEFHETVMGHRFYENTMPELIKTLKNIESKIGSVEPAKSIPKEIFVCCEENSPELSRECGATNNFCVFTDAEKSMKWLTDALDEGKNNGYVPAGYRTIPGNASDHVIICIPLYSEVDENNTRNYMLVIRKFEI